MRFPPFRLLAILSASALMLLGCVGSQGKLSVDLKQSIAACQRLGGERPIPVITEDTDYRDLSSKALAELNKGNSGARARKRCEDGVVDKYAKAARE